MNATEFIEELKKIPIDKELLLSKSLTEDYIENLINSYRIEKKVKVIIRAQIQCWI